MHSTGNVVRYRVLALAAVVWLLAAGCSDQTAESTTTTDPTTTTTSEDTTTTSTPPTTGSPTDTNDLASGSGCKPGTQEGLPDGEWYGYIRDVNSTEIDFDLACWFSGDAAVAAASEDGAESPPPNDYYVRNENETVRSLAVAGSAEVEYLTNLGDPNTQTRVGYEDWYVEWELGDFVPGYWLTIEDGQVTEIVQQYVP